MWMLVGAGGWRLVVGFEAAILVVAQRRDFLPFRRRSRDHLRRRDERQVEADVLHCCFVLEDRSRIAQDSEGIRCQPRI